MQFVLLHLTDEEDEGQSEDCEADVDEGTGGCALLAMMLVMLMMLVMIIMMMMGMTLMPVITRPSRTTMLASTVREHETCTNARKKEYDSGNE